MKRTIRNKTNTAPEQKRGEEYISAPPIKRNKLHSLPTEKPQNEWEPYNAKGARRAANFGQKYQAPAGLTKRNASPTQEKNVHAVPKSLKARKSDKSSQGKKRRGL